MTYTTVVFTCGHVLEIKEELTPEQRWEAENILICPACIQHAILEEMA